MFILSLKGTLTSKFALHVPVVRRWRLVWERREFGTRIDDLDRDIFLFDEWDRIPEGGIVFKVAGDWSIRVKRVLGGEDMGLMVAVSALWNGIEVPGTYKVFPLPLKDLIGHKKLFDWKTEVWKGVKLDVDAAVAWKP